MTAYQYEEYKLLCDSGDCRARFGPRAGKRAEVRRLARKAGWTHVHEPGTPYHGDLDFCADHKPRTCAACALGGDLVEIKPGTWACADFVACHERTEEGTR